MSRTWLGGVRAVEEALRGERPVDRLAVARESRIPRLELLLALAKERGVPCDYMPLAKLGALTHSDTHQGIAARVAPLAYQSLDEWLAACPPRSLLVALDEVQHPRNLGLILRAALGAGAAGALLPQRGGALVDDDVIHASAGAAQRLPLISCGNLAQALRELRAADFWVYGLDAKAPQNVFDTDWPTRCVLVVGNETHGLRPGVRKVCDALLGIPLAHELDSLNVALAAGIALFQTGFWRGTD